MDFILNRLPPAPADIYVDASYTWGVGGQGGEAYFAFPWSDLGAAATEFIARHELLACMLAIFCFADSIRGRWFRIYTDNESVFFWLIKGRSSNVSGTKYLAIQELGKYLLESKVTPQWIPSETNNIADDLSRGKIPQLFRNRGHRKTLPEGMEELLSLSPIDTWKKILFKNRTLQLSSPNLF